MNHTLENNTSSAQAKPVCAWHICIVTGQVDANLLPALDPNYRPKNLLLLETQQMQKNTGALIDALQNKGINAVVLPFEDSLNYKEMSEKIGAWIYDCPSQDQIIINLTGGTKIMTLALFDIAVETGTAAIYLDYDTKNIINILDLSKEATKLNEQINLIDYLISHGYNPKSNEMENIKKFSGNESYDEYCEWLVLSHDLVQYDIGDFNGWTHDLFENKKPKKIINENNLLAKQCLKQDFLTISTDGAENLLPNDRSTLEFLKSNWLEYFTAKQVDKISKKKPLDYTYDLSVFDKYGNENQFDCIFIAKNTLHIIECKAQNMKAESGKNATDAIYKIDSLGKVGGLATKRMIVSFRELNAHDRNRAFANNIEVVEGRQVRNLLQRLHAWIGR